jgi:transcriptional regulator with XRE-family HTH domain
LAKGIHDQRYLRIVEALKAQRERLGLSQTEAGLRIGHRQQFVSKYESGERRLDFIEFVDVAVALSLDWRTLVEDALQSK